MDELILVALLIGVLVLVLPVIAIITAMGAKNAVRELQADIERLKIRVKDGTAPVDKAKAAAPADQPKIAAKENPEPIKSKAAWVPPEQKAGTPDQPIETPAHLKTSQKPVEPPKAPTPPKPVAPDFMDRLAANFKANWIIWLAAVSLAFGGLFIVQYGLERGFLGPVARVICALAFGGALLVAAEYLRRKPNMGMEGWFTVPVALAAGGIASLYAGVVSAHVLYDLTSPLVGFASMVAVSFLAIGAGLIYGPILAVVGILGAYISPMLVTGGESSPILYLYFLAVLVTALSVERFERWIWLSAIAVGFSLFWGLILNADISNQPYLAFYGVAIILAVTTIPAFGVWPKWDRTDMLDEKSLGDVATHYPTVLTILTAAGATLLMCFAASESLILWQVTLLTLLGLIYWSVFWCARAQNLDQVSLIFMAGLLFSAAAANPLDRAGFYAIAYFSLVGSVSIAAAVAFLIASFWRTPRSVRPLYWVATGAIAPVLTYFLIYASWHWRTPFQDIVWAFFAILLAAILACSALLMLRGHIRQRRLASDLMFAGMLVTTSFAAYLIVEMNYLAHTAALLSLAALALVIRFKYRWTGYLIWAFVAAATALVVFDLFPVYSLREPVLLVVAVFGVVAGMFAVGYVSARDANLSNRVILYETAFLLTIALLVCALIARVASNGRWEFEYMVLGLYATVWIMMAGVQFRRMIIDDRLTNVRQLLGFGYGALGLGALALSIVMSPLFGDRIRGFFPIDTVMVAYGLPTVVAYALYHFKLLPGFVTRKMALAAVGAMGGFIVVQEIRRFWHGSNIGIHRGTEVGELYTYTVMLLVATVASIVLAITRKDPMLRKIGLGLAAVTAAKVFLWDTAGMQGLARATVFIALGLTLAGVGWLLQAQAANDQDQDTTEDA